MQKGLLLLALGATLAIGFFAGRVSSGDAAGDPGGEGGENTAQGPRRSRSGERNGPDSSGTPVSRLRQEIRKAAPDQLGKLVYRTLELGDPILRRQLLFELYERMDASNFEAMTDQLAKISLETARDNYDEWLLGHTRAGQVAGQAAMERWNKPEMLGSDQAQRTLWGWATKDPESAKRWLDGNLDVTPAQRVKLLAQLTAGAILANPEQAKKMIADLPDQERVGCVQLFTSHMVQNYGKDGAVDWMKSVISAYPDSAYSQAVTQKVFDKLVWSGANQRNANSMIGDLERLSTTIPITEDWIVRGMGQIRDRKAIGGIELLDKITSSPVLGTMELGDRAWNSAVDYALQRDRPAVEQWLADNPDSPIHERVAEFAARPRPPRPAQGLRGTFGQPEIPGR